MKALLQVGLTGRVPVPPEKQFLITARRTTTQGAPVSLYTGKGRILRVKHGYNPNSSSVGSVIFAFSAKILAATAGFGVIAGIIYSAFVRRGRKHGSRNAEAGSGGSVGSATDDKR